MLNRLLADFAVSSIKIRSFSGQECYCCRYRLIEIIFFHLSVLEKVRIERTDRTGWSSFSVLDNERKERCRCVGINSASLATGLKTLYAEILQILLSATIHTTV